MKARRATLIVAVIAAAFGLLANLATAAAPTDHDLQNAARDAVDPATWETTWPVDTWETATPAEMGMDASLLAQAEAYALTGYGSGMIIRGGKLVKSWGSLSKLYDLKSTTKSIGGTAAGLAVADNLLAFGDRAQQYLATVGVPPSSNISTGWLDDITLLQLATHTAGFDKPGGYIPLLYAPGTIWSYSDGGMNWMADVLTVTFGEDLNSLLFRRVFAPIGITSADLVWRSNPYREDTIEQIKRRELGSGISANVDAMARIGYLYLRNGAWDGIQLIPSTFVDTVRRPSPSVVGLPVADPVKHPGASDHYGVFWFTNADGTMPQVPTDAYWGWGLRDSILLVIPSLDIVAVRAGQGLGRSTWDADYSWISPFITPIAQSASPLIPPVQVPDVTGLAQSAAQSAITAADLVVGSVSTALSSTVPAGHVISQNPVAGSSVSPGSAVSLLVSAGPASVVVPDVVGLVQAAAESVITGAGLLIGTVTATPSETVSVGYVMSQSPAAGASVGYNSSVALEVSSGPRPTRGAYLDFDGADDRVVIASSATLRLANAITVEAWIQPRTIASSKNQDRIVRNGNNYELTISTGDTGCAVGTRGDVQWRSTIGGNDRRICGGRLTNGTWHHVAGTYNGSSFALYVDGSLVASMSRSGTMTTGSTPVLIGNHETSARGFDGGLDRVGVWSRALSAGEILARVATDLTGGESNLVAYWRFDEGSGQRSFDATHNANDGTLGTSASVDSADPKWRSAD